eukprot:141331_1
MEAKFVFNSLSQKDQRLLRTIVNQILDNPNNTKYQSLKLSGIKKKTEKNVYCIEILKRIGFSISNDGERLIFDTMRMNDLQMFHQHTLQMSFDTTQLDDKKINHDQQHEHIQLFKHSATETVKSLIQEGFTWKEALDAIASSADDTIRPQLSKLNSEILNSCVNTEDLNKLTNMGFDVETARYALLEAKGNVNDALLILLNEPKENIDSNQQRMKDGDDMQHKEFKDPQDAPFINNQKLMIFDFDAKDTKCLQVVDNMISKLDEMKLEYKDTESTDVLFNSNPYLRSRDIFCDVKTCKHMNNISSILRRYHSNINSDEMYSEDYTHVNLLNDYHHLLNIHSDQFEEIYNFLRVNIAVDSCCKLKSCVMMRRNERTRTNANDDTMDTYGDNPVQQQLLDCIHCFYLHSFDTGYMLTRLDRQKILESDVKTDDEIAIDKIFHNINAKVKSYRSTNPYAQPMQKFVINNDVISNKMEMFSYGYRYFYWRFYKNNTSKYDPTYPEAGISQTHHIGNFSISDAGYSLPTANGKSSLSDWYIPAKYGNLKEELLQNTICTLSENSYNILYSKALIHQQTSEVRNRVCANEKCAKYYEIIIGDIMSLDQLIAIMVQCNYTDLQYQFRRTFRKIETTEDDQHVQLKKRHSNYYWMGRSLRECVECFGMRKQIEFDSKYRQPINIHIWVGLNQKFVFSSMFAFIKAPISTTMDYAVANNFSQNAGLVLELCVDNQWIFAGPNGSSRKPVGQLEVLSPAQQTGMSVFNCFDCAWISKYPNEQEIFSIGGQNRFNFETISTVTGINYKFYIEGMKHMTSCMSVGDKPSMFPFLEHIQKQMVFRLISHQLWKNKEPHKYAHEFKSCPEYVKELLDHHCKSVTKILVSENRFAGIIWNLFKYDNGWIKVALIHHIFPNAERITFNATKKDRAWITNESIWKSILFFIETHRQDKLKVIEIILIRENVGGFLDKCIINKYKKSFKKRFWDIKIEQPPDNVPIITTSMGKIMNQFSILMINNSVIVEMPGVGITVYDRTRGYPF